MGSGSCWFYKVSGKWVVLFLQGEWEVGLVGSTRCVGSGSCCFHRVSGKWVVLLLQGVWEVGRVAFTG